MTLRGDGLGGRNQEFVLAAALETSRACAMWWCSAPAPTAATALPTRPAPSPMAIPFAAIPKRAAIWTATTRINYFQALNDLVITGPTDTNVMDVRIMLVGAGSEFLAQRGDPAGARRRDRASTWKSSLRGLRASPRTRGRIFTWRSSIAWKAVRTKRSA